MTISCLLPHKLLISLIVYNCHQERQNPWFDLRVPWGLARCLSFQHLPTIILTLPHSAPWAEWLSPSYPHAPSHHKGCMPTTPSTERLISLILCQASTHFSSLSSGFTPSNLSSLTSVTKWYLSKNALIINHELPFYRTYKSCDFKLKWVFNGHIAIESKERSEFRHNQFQRL